MTVELRVWWIPQVPMKAFLYPVPTIEAGEMLLDALAEYDVFQYEHRIKPDYCKWLGLVVWYDFDPRNEWECEEVVDAIAKEG